MNKLTNKQKLFCKEYMVDLNATQSAIRAGYSKKTANEQAGRLLVNVSVQAEIQKLMDKRSARLDLKADDILNEIKTIAFSDIKDYLSFDENGVIFKDSEEIENSKVISEISSQKTITRSGGSGDNKDETERVNFKLKLHDKLKALELAGRHLKLFTDRVELSGAVKTPVTTVRLIEVKKPDGT